MIRRGIGTLLLITTLLVAPASSGPPAYGSPQPAPAAHLMVYGSAPDAPDSRLQAIVEEVVGDLPGVWGVAVKKLDTGQYATVNPDRQHVSASLYKMWVLNELFRQVKAGVVSLDDVASVTGADAYYDSLFGELRLAVGNAITLRQAAYLMITVSDNTSAALLVRTLGPENIRRFMRQNGLNHSVFPWDGPGDNLTTPLDVLGEMELLATSRMVDADASRQMVEIMLDQKVNNLLAPGLPHGTPFAHKHGALGGLLHDAGIVYGPSGPFVIVAMSSRLASYSTAYNNMPKLIRRVYDYFNTRPSSPVLYFPQTRQTVGHEFLRFWHTHGGLRTFGLPVGPEQMRGDLLVQSFERARFERRLTNGGNGASQTSVLLGLVGQERAAQLGLSWPRGPDGGGGRYFPETGQTLAPPFLDFWLNNGGERLFGLPISPAADMVNPTDGKTYLTQWFQRARMELHTELEGGSVLLGPLVSEGTRTP